jgi:prolyl oligopeptidase
LLNEGGVYAIACLRGGGEKGKPWHEAGMLDKKQNVFDDFAAGAEYLIAQKYTNATRLAAQGRSNGGLLVGAVLTQRPELFRAVDCHVPLLDMIRYDRFGYPPWTAEYGSAAQSRVAFEWLLAYSPYHRAEQKQAYPAVLLVAGSADTNVVPMHARKMVARLQANTSSDRPIVYQETPWGHEATLSLTHQIQDATNTFSFLCEQLGITVSP